MKILELLKVITLSIAAIIAFFMLGNGFLGVIGRIPAKGTYYYLPEANLYIKREGNIIRLCENLGLLKLKRESGFYDVDFRIKSDRYRSELLFPVDNNQIRRVYVKDPNNTLAEERISGSIIWLAECDAGCEIPHSITIELPFKKWALHYSLPDGTIHQALVLDKGTVDTAKVDRYYCRQEEDPLDVLPSYRMTGKIEDANIHINQKSDGIVSLHIRDNIIECGPPIGEQYPFFCYNPHYPHFIFCDDGNYITHRNCKDIHLITGNRNLHHIENIDNWYLITLKPFKVKEL